MKYGCRDRRDMLRAPWLLKVERVKTRLTVNDHPSQSYARGASPAIIRHRWTRPAFRQAGRPAGRYSIYLPRRDRRLGDNIQVVTGPGVEQLIVLVETNELAAVTFL